ncbi:hypothetical protein B0H67DRAFT_558879 [Lasiosphaeris hirsuta]|uniref:Uncharacterized protein n=1 Tax=Lasiosphaeris hirsuta TaxID=260670 RepID=A0AA40B877_9PEZI|nr:hypothetical protein B0H67DRAFT_558879 [Lasiosphaeris hirsuta]
MPLCESELITRGILSFLLVRGWSRLRFTPTEFPNISFLPVLSSTFTVTMSWWSLVNDPCIQFIKNWIEHNIDRVECAYNLKGGWEGWAQVELAAAMRDQYQAYQPRVEREMEIQPASHQRCDIVFRIAQQPGILKSGCSFIELKCESVRNAAEFVRGMEEDRDKITAAHRSAGRLLIWGEETEFYSVGICVGPTGKEGIRRFVQEPANRGQYSSETVPFARGEIEIWYKKLTVPRLYPDRLIRP